MLQADPGEVRCLGPAGFHVMRYVQWGDAANPRVLVCGHGLTRTGRDFDRLARALSGRMRVVCPDVVGRGRSDCLRDPRGYDLAQYAADMNNLFHAIGATEVDWLGTSMGGLIGLTLAGQPGSPIRRLVLNDIGPRMELDALHRIGAYVGLAPHFASIEQAVDYTIAIAPGFGLRNRDQWREATVSVLRPDGDGYTFHYDPSIGIPMRAMDESAIAAGQALAWKLYDAIACPTLLIRGERSDLLSLATAAEMCERGPRPRLVTFPGIGHAPMFFDPAQIAVVDDFLSD
jgi:pimeloyl-ACP methyl ester carboxylesterase